MTDQVSIADRIADATLDDLRAIRAELAEKINTTLAGEVTDEALAQAETFGSDLDAVNAAIEAAEDREAKLSALRDKGAKFSSTDDAGSEGSGSDDSDADATGGDGGVADVDSVRSAVAASGSSVDSVHRDKSDEDGPTLTIVAAADVPEFPLGKHLNGIDEVATALMNRAAGFPRFGSVSPSRNSGRSELHKFGVASIKLPFDDRLTVRNGDAGETFRVLEFAADESRLPGGDLTAAGWCAPSDNVLDLCAPGSNDGLLDVPEFAVNGGGVNHSSGPNFADLYAGGFFQTEAEAIANEEKDCDELDCPPFDETRLDAIGYCLRIGLLMEAGLPQYVRAAVQGAIVAHRHRINARTISQIVAGSTPQTITGLGTSAGDLLDGLELVAEGRREKFRLGLNQRLVVAVPSWVRGIIRADLAKRMGLSSVDVVTDEVIQRHFSARHLRLQFVYDWEELDLDDQEGAPAYPSTFQALMYPEGTWKRGVKPVINLSAVYDHASLTVNQYTGVFVEQGILVVKSCYDSDVLTIPTCSAGRVGAADLTCAEDDVEGETP